jgi:hypothetical protein
VELLQDRAIVHYFIETALSETTAHKPEDFERKTKGYTFDGSDGKKSN